MSEPLCDAVSALRASPCPAQPARHRARRREPRKSVLDGGQLISGRQGGVTILVTVGVGMGRRFFPVGVGTGCG
ncbi:hypothetical protein ABZW49_16205 [Nonomuraea wenchangensis]